MSKISIIGAGNVGATAAQFIAMKEIADEVVLVDVKEGYAEGKAMDISQSLFLLNSKTEVSGYTKNYKPTKDSDIIVITSGVPRKPGMTREELVGVNAGVVKAVLEEAYKYSPNAIYVIVSNPMDTMTYLAVKYLKKLGKDNAETTVIGMGGLLDTARYHYYQAKEADHEAETGPRKMDKEYVDGIVVGGHGDTTMIPICGATLTSLLGTSAWMAPAAGITQLVEDILGNFTFAETPQSVYREEYGACIGSAVTLCREGVLEIDKGDWEDTDSFKESLAAVKEVNKDLGENKKKNKRVDLISTLFFLIQ